MRKILFVICFFFAAVSCDDSKVEPIEKYKGTVIAGINNPQSTMWSELTLKTPDSISKAYVLKFDIENKYVVGDTIR